MKKTILATLLAATCASAIAANYFVVVPVQNRKGADANISVSLSGFALPAGQVGHAYAGFDFNTVLQVQGDPNFSPATVHWSVAGGALPAGLSLSASGVLSGTPTAGASSDFQVQAAYRTKAGEQAYQVFVADVKVSLAGATLPALMAGTAMSYDLTNTLTVTGDPKFDLARVSWTSDGGLPAGLALGADGRITGTPMAVGVRAVNVTAAYAGERSAPAAYSLSVSANVKDAGGYRTWSDGSLAASCLAYRNPARGYLYSGATGDGVYRIDVDGTGPLTPFDVQCDMTTDGGGWTVFQRRINGAVDFYRNYAQYAAGFGSTTEYWLGNDRLAAMTAAGAHSLRVDMARKSGETAYALYNYFSVANAAAGYRLSLTWVTGTAGDSMSQHNGYNFSTYDAGNTSCATQYHGAWWYMNCHYSNLNGAYLNGAHTSYADGIEWNTWTGYNESLVKTEMKVR